ncbi:hypothetical protein ISCGN_026677 [Ixodes scapularis]
MQTRHRAAADQGETGEGPDPTSMDLMARVANLCDTVAQRLVLADPGPQGQGPRPQVPVPLYTGYDDRKSVADFLAELAAYKLATGASDDQEHGKGWLRVVRDRGKLCYRDEETDAAGMHGAREPEKTPRYHTTKRAVKQEPLPKNDYKIIMKPREGLNFAKWSNIAIARSLSQASELPIEAMRGRVIFRGQHDQNTVIISTADIELATRLRDIDQIRLGDYDYAVHTYSVTPQDSAKRADAVIPGPKSEHTTLNATPSRPTTGQHTREPPTGQHTRESTTGTRSPESDEPLSSTSKRPRTEARGDGEPDLMEELTPGPAEGAVVHQTGDQGHLTEQQQLQRMQQQNQQMQIQMQQQNQQQQLLHLRIEEIFEILQKHVAPETVRQQQQQQHGGTA